MEACADLHDWELILGSDLSDNLRAVAALEDDTEDGALKPNYFTIDSGGHLSPQSDEGSNEDVDDSDNPSWADPDSESRLLEISRGQFGFGELELPIRNSGGFLSDESSDGLRSLPDGEKVVLGGLEYSFTETASEGTDARCENLGGESEGSDISGTREVIPGDGGSISDGNKRENVWWKMPTDLLKFYIFRVRPVWPLSIAAAMVGVVMLWRKLYRMKHKSRRIPLRIDIDDKKASQFTARAARLKEAVSVVRHMPIMRSALPAGGATKWAALPP